MQEYCSSKEGVFKNIIGENLIYKPDILLELFEIVVLVVVAFALGWAAKKTSGNFSGSIFG
jgi:hypothetical protein